ncbi:lipase/esterase-like protein [Limtongia smithiae]|uniref:lipase/esterase-like protein n=1 Tax=Limtongia smithiae TaxID=1125753 RepID=UPI0034CDC6CF
MASTVDIPLAPEWLEWEAKIGARPVLSDSVPHMREQFDGLGKLLAEQWGEPIPGVSTKDMVTDSGLDVRVYRPDASADKLVPLGVFFHCGGYCIGGIIYEDNLVRNLCVRSQTVIVSVQYRHAPEFSAPTALNDAADATLWAVKNAESFGADSTKVYTMGASAGAALSVSTFLKLYDDGHKDLISGIVSLSPCFVHPDLVSDHAGKHTSFVNSNGVLPVIDENSMRIFYDTYNAPLDHPHIFALNYPDMSVFPKTYIAAAEFDPLRDDSVLLSEKLALAKVDHKLKTYSSLPHVFWLFPIPQSLTFFDDTAAAIRDVLSL